MVVALGVATSSLTSPVAGNVVLAAHVAGAITDGTRGVAVEFAAGVLDDVIAGVAAEHDAGAGVGPGMVVAKDQVIATARSDDPVMTAADEPVVMNVVA